MDEKAFLLPKLTSGWFYLTDFLLASAKNRYAVRGGVGWKGFLREFPLLFIASLDKLVSLRRFSLLALAQVDILALPLKYRVGERSIK